MIGRHITTLAASLIAMTAVSVAIEANAGNAEGIYFGEQAVLTGGAVRAIVDDGSATIYNPAGLGSIDTQVLNVSLSAFQFRTQKLRDAYVLDGVDAYSIQGSELTPLPTSIAFSRPLGENWRMGLGVFTSSFENTAFEVDGNAETGDFSFDTDFELQVKKNVFRAGAGFGRRFSENVQFGFSIAAQFASKAASSSISLDRVGSDSLASRLVTSRSQQTIVGITGIAGLMVRISDRWRFGGVIELPTFRIFETASARSSTLYSSVVGGQSEAFESTEGEEASVQETSVVLTFVRVHTSFAFDKGPWTVTLEGDISLENGLQLDSVLQGVWNLRGGVQYTTPKNITVGFGVFTDRVQETQIFESAFGEYQFAGVSSAIRFQNKHQLQQEDGTSRPLVFSSTFGLRYAYGSSEFNPRAVSVDDITRDPDPSTKYAHELTLYIASTFAF